MSATYRRGKRFLYVCLELVEFGTSSHRPCEYQSASLKDMRVHRSWTGHKSVVKYKRVGVVWPGAGR